MAQKDPAVLFFISDWLTSTAEMDADCKGWYLNLILHNYDKKSLPNDVEKLALLAGVKFSEFNRFEQVFEQVLKQKFEQTSDNRLTNDKTQTILQNREIFKEKRSSAGKMSYLMKFFAKNFTKEYKNQQVREFVKNNIDIDIDTKNEQVIKQVFKQVFELYRNEIENENEIIINNKSNSIKTEFDFLKNSEFKEIFNRWLDYKNAKNQKYKNEDSIKTCYNKLIKLSNNNLENAIEIIDSAIGNNYNGFFELKNNIQNETRNNKQNDGGTFGGIPKSEINRVFGNS